MKRCVLGVLLALAGTSFAEQAPSAASSDIIFWCQAGGISGARLKQLTQQHSPACRTTTPCGQALGKTESNSVRTSASLRKSATNTACACSSPAAQIAALVRDKKYAAAEAKIRTFLRDDAGNPWAQFVLGTILRQQNRFEEAFDVFTESAKLMPNFPETHSQLSYLFYRDDDSDNAIAEARTALSMDPKNAEAYRYLGLALYSAGRYDAALNAFEPSLVREPANADV